MDFDELREQVREIEKVLDPAIDEWMKAHEGKLGVITRHWFEMMRKRGDEVRALA